jgi:anaerobic ribonucleoside-triphosphate reductase
VSGISLEKAGSKELWDLFYALMKLSRENLDIEIERLWKHINRHKFPQLINEAGESSGKKLLESLDGADVSGVIDRGRGLI